MKKWGRGPMNSIFCRIVQSKCAAIRLVSFDTLTVIGKQNVSFWLSCHIKTLRVDRTAADFDKRERGMFIMEWVYLVIAGLLEVFWSTCLKFSEGFTVMKFTVLTIIGMVFSFLFLSQATKQLPLGTSYAIWTGIGALGAVIVGIVLFKESVTAPRMLFVALLLIGIIGLKATSGH